MENFVRDVRTSVRTLLKKPGFTVVVVLMLAFGIAANTAIFSVVNGVLLRRLPYRQDDRIVTVWQSAPKRGVEREETSPANFFDWLEPFPKGDPLAVGREPWPVSSVGNPPFFTAQRRDHVNAPAIAVGTEDDAGAVGREVRLIVISLMMRQADWLTTANLLHPDIETSVAAAVGSVGDQFS